MKLSRQVLQPVPGVVAILYAALAQYAHVFHQADEPALILFAAALGLWAIAFVTVRTDIPTRISDTASSSTRARHTSRGIAVGAAVLAILTFLFSGDNEFTPDNVLAWLLSIGAFFYAFWEPQRSWGEWRAWLRERAAAARATFADGIRISSRTLLLIGILAIGVFSYYYDLEGVPAEMDSDHAEKILDVNDVVNGARPIFFERNTGREPMEFYLVAALVQIGHHPLTHVALKLVTAAMGLLIVPGTYLLARELFADDVAFLAAALIAVGKWPMTISRMGLRFPFTPVSVAPLLFFLFRAFKYQRRNDFLMAGFFLGVGLYGYNAFRVGPLLVIVFLVLWPLIGRRLPWAQVRSYAANSLLMFTLMFVILMPLVRYSVDHPENAWYRMSTRLTGEGGPLPENPASILAGNLIDAALMFNWTGDSAWPNSIVGDPALDYISGGLFLLGVAYALYRLARYRETVYAFVLIGTVILLLPSALSLAFPNENPSVVRAGGAIPLVFIVAALPLAWLLRAFQHALSGYRWGAVASAGLIVLLVALIARANYMRYFRDFDASYRQASWNSSEVAGAIRGFAESIGDIQHAWILLYPHWIDTRNVAINMGHIAWDQTLPGADDAQSQVNDGANKLYVLNPNDIANLSRLRQIFPGGEQRLFHARTPGHDFVLFYVPGLVAPSAPLGLR